MTYFLYYLGMDECFGTNFLDEPNFGTEPETKWDKSHVAPADDIAITVNDATDADLPAFFASPAGELFVAKGGAIVVGDTFTVTSNADTTDNALEGAKGAAVAAGDIFVVTDISTEAVVFVVTDIAGPKGNIQLTVSDITDANLAAFFAGELLAAKTAAGDVAIAVGDIFKVQGTGDTTDNALEAAKGSGVVDEDIFVVTDISTEAVIFVGNNVAVYAFSTDQTSKLIQTAANRVNAGVALRAYVYTYTVAVHSAPDATAFTLEGYGNSVTLPVTAGPQEVIFAAPVGAAAADFEIRSTSEGATQGVITFDAMALRGIVKEGVTPSKNNADIPFAGKWGGIQAIEGAATVSAIGYQDTGLTSLSIAEGDTIFGKFIEVRCTSGIIAVYRVND